MVPTDQILELPGYQHIYSGKVRDLYAPLDPQTGQPRDDQVLLVASDRISAFDHVLTTPIPDKGRVLTQLSLWWFDRLEALEHHVVSAQAPAVPAAVAGRAVLVRRLEMIPVECVARAYLTGGGLAEYERTGAVSGVPLPPGLQDGSRLPLVGGPEPRRVGGEHLVGEHDDRATIGVLTGAVDPELDLRVGNENALGRGDLVAPGQDPPGEHVDPGGQRGADRLAHLVEGHRLVVLADRRLRRRGEDRGRQPPSILQPGR